MGLEDKRLAMKILVWAINKQPSNVMANVEIVSMLKQMDISVVTDVKKISASSVQRALKEVPSNLALKTKHSLRFKGVF